MNKIALIKTKIANAASIPQDKQAVFFKTGPGQYAEHDKFIGAKVPILRKIAKDFYNLTLDELESLLISVFNEERLVALFIIIYQYQNSDNQTQEKIYQFYLQNRQQINNWNLVDASAHHIIGAHLWKRDKNILLTLAESSSLWERRIAMVATWYFIRQKDLTWTFSLSEKLLQDKEDLMHKATGWMLREAGKQDQQQLIQFLNQYTPIMPRTILRYAIEKLSADEKLFFMSIPRR